MLEQEYFTDAVTADLTVDLSRIRDIAVIAAASAYTYKDRTADPRQIGRELGVRYLVTGAIARVGDLVRTNVQLVDAASGEQIWADRFEYQFAELGRLENAITGRIAASLNVQLLRAEGRRAELSMRPDALDLRLRATAKFLGSIAPEHTLAARHLLLQSVELDPNAPDAWARLARGHGLGSPQSLERYRRGPAARGRGGGAPGAADRPGPRAGAFGERPHPPRARGEHDSAHFEAFPAGRSSSIRILHSPMPIRAAS